MGKGKVKSILFYAILEISRIQKNFPAVFFTYYATLSNLNLLFFILKSLVAKYPERVLLVNEIKPSTAVE